MAIEKLSWNLIDSLGQPIVGATPTIRIRELSSGLSLDWDDHLFKASGWGTLDALMPEVGAPYPGLYELNADLRSFTGKYQLFTQYGAYSSTTEVILTNGQTQSFQGGLSTQQATMLLEMYNLLGLDPTIPLVVTKTSRQAGSINQAVNSNTNTTIVTRI